MAASVSNLQLWVYYMELGSCTTALSKNRTPFKPLYPLHIYATQPAYAVLGELLHLRPQLRLVQIEIINGTDAQDALLWRS